MAALEKNAALSRHQIERHGREVLAAIQKGMDLPVAELPRYPRQKPKSISAAVSDRIQRLRRWRDAQARRLKIEPSLICSKTAMNSIAECKPFKTEDLAEVDGLRQWQRKAFAKDMLSALQRAR
jgi:ribonuclease D